MSSGKFSNNLPKPEMNEYINYINQVVIAGIIYNCEMVLTLLDQIRFPNSAEPIGADQFIRKWLSHIEDFTGIHDRRVCIMGLCALMQSRIVSYFLVDILLSNSYNEMYKVTNHHAYLNLEFKVKSWVTIFISSMASKKLFK